MSDVDALLEERRGYVARGLKDRVAQVDAVLAGMGFATDADELEVQVDVDPDLETAATGRGRKKTSRAD